MLNRIDSAPNIMGLTLNVRGPNWFNPVAQIFTQMFILHFHLDI